MVPEARLALDRARARPRRRGWFVLNAREARWCHGDGRSAICDLEGEPEFAQVGINLNGEALLITEGEERPLRQWDFVHCPPETKHVIVGAGAERETTVPAEAYARFPSREPTRYREGWLPE